MVLTENDDCSGPMAARFLNDFSDEVEAMSAGVCAAGKVNDGVTELMRECFCDLSGYKPVQFERGMIASADLVVVVGELSGKGMPCGALLMEVPRHLQADETVEGMRALRDHVKNEAFVLWKSVVSRPARR